MDTAIIDLGNVQLDPLCLAKRVLPMVLLVVFWCWETWLPFFGKGEGRVRHAFRNLAIALINTIVLAAAFSSVTVLPAERAESHHYGLLHSLNRPIRHVLPL